MKKYLPLAVFLLVAVASLAMAGFAYVAAGEAARIKFEGVADDALNRIEARVEMHTALLRATLSFFEASDGQVTRVELERFVDRLNVERRYPGIRGIGYAVLVEAERTEAVEAELRRVYGREIKVEPPTTGQRLRTPIVLLTPEDERNRAAIGFDMFSEPIRRAAMTEAMEDGEARASGVVELVQGLGDSRYTGFLIYLPLQQRGSDDPGDVAGFVYAPFRAGDLFNAALGRAPILPVNVEVRDGTDPDAAPFFTSETPPDPAFGEDYTVRREIEVSGRTWTIRFRPTAVFSLPSSRLVPVMLGLVGLLLAIAMALLSRYQERAFEAANELHRATEKRLVERDLMLQEMKHRIKNSITRVLAIARQTAASSGDLKEFSSSFSARLQAMSASQDMLTRSRWQKADLGELLRTELEQVFGDDLDEETLDGPPVEVDGTTTQALGLTFHELATNALKYGDTEKAEDALRVRWRVIGQAGAGTLHIDWVEKNSAGLAAPEKTGFGTRLIDMNITRELGGTISRDFGPEGLRIGIVIPLRGEAKQKGRPRGTPFAREAAADQ